MEIGVQTLESLQKKCQITVSSSFLSPYWLSVISFVQCTESCIIYSNISYFKSLNHPCKLSWIFHDVIIIIIKVASSLVQQNLHYFKMPFQNFLFLFFKVL